MKRFTPILLAMALVLGLGPSSVAPYVSAGPSAAEAGIRQPQRNARRVPAASNLVAATLDYVLVGGGGNGSTLGTGQGGNPVLVALGSPSPAIGSYSVVIGTAGTASSWNGLTSNGGVTGAGAGGAGTTSNISGANVTYGKDGQETGGGEPGDEPGEGGNSGSGAGAGGRLVIRYLTSSQTWTGCAQTIDGAYTVRTCNVSTTLQRTL